MVIEILFAVFVIFLLKNFLWNSKIPGPSFWETYKNADRIPYFLHECVMKYGKTFIMNNGWQSVVIVANPEDLKHILLSLDQFPKNMTASTFSAPLRQTFSYAMVFSNNPSWRNQRTVCNPAFHVDYLKGYLTNVFGEYSHKTINLLNKCDGMQQEITSIMSRFTLDVLGKATFSYDFHLVDEEKSETNAYVEAYHNFLGNSLNPRLVPFLFSEKLPFPITKKVFGAIRTLKKLLAEIMAAKRNGTSSGNPDLLDMIMNSNLSEEEISHNVMAFFAAGHETTATALSWMFYSLSKNQDKQELLRQEIDSVLQGRLPTYDDISQLPYLEMVVKEGMRMYPPVGYMRSRVTSQIETFGGYQIQKGTTVIMPIWSMHHNPEFWEDPEQFKPERWSKENRSKINPYSYMPFSKGPRSCIGNKFSVLEQKIFIIHLLQNFVLGESSMQRVHASTFFKPIQLNVVLKKRKVE